MKTTILILLGISLLFFSTVLFLLADEQQNNNKPHILNVPNKHTKEIVQDEIKTCIKVLNGELPPTSYDGGKSQCVIDLVHLNADPKIVYPIFLNCLKNDKDEDAKKEIVVSILRFNKGQEVRKLLLQIANKKIDKGQKYIQGTIQNEAALELVSLRDISIIPTAIKMLEEYEDGDVFQYSAVKKDEFQTEAIKQLETNSDKNTNTLYKIRIEKVLVLHYEKNPMEEIDILNQGLTQNDEQTKIETLGLISEMQGEYKKIFKNYDEIKSFNNIFRNKVKKIKVTKENKGYIDNILETSK